jgi:hypothetical protein
MNCKTCKYAQINTDNCFCYIHILNTGNTIIIANDKIDLECPCHSDLKHEETRYGFQSSNRYNSFDVCESCKRIVYNLNNLKIISEKIKNKIIEKRICTICSS